MNTKDTKEAKNPQLGDYIRARRQSRGLSYYDAASLSGLDHTYWRKLEAGQYEQPSPAALAKVAATIEAPLADLYTLAGYEPATELPTLQPYLRSKYHLPPEAIDQLESYFQFLRAQYGIPSDTPVFPPKQASSGDDDRWKA